jgi:hypothetical protein
MCPMESATPLNILQFIQELHQLGDIITKKLYYTIF